MSVDIESFLSEPLVAAIVSVALVVVLVVVVIFLCVARRSINHARGPYFCVQKLVMAGHARIESDQKDMATAMYRAAVFHICRAALCTQDLAALTEAGDAEAGCTVDLTEALRAADKALRDYNSKVYLSVALSCGLPTEASLQSAPYVRVVAYGGVHGQLGIEVDNEFRVTSVLEGAAAAAGVSVEDELLRLCGKSVNLLATEDLQGQLQTSKDGGRASFKRDGSGAEGTLVCSRCASPNRSTQDPGHCFHCYSCQATVLPWLSLTMPPPVVEPPELTELLRPLRRQPFRQPDRRRRVEPGNDKSTIEDMTRFKDLVWETSGLAFEIKHPTGFGLPRPPPDGCIHHGQVGATCGMAAVNNLITNVGGTAVNAEYMFAISDRLGQAEAVLRDGAQSVEEAGEQQNLVELYAASSGGHFDVQTLQTAFEEAGFSMWYLNPQRLDCSRLFDWAVPRPASRKAKSQSSIEPPEQPTVGYVVHRRDALNSRQDHWFVVRQHDGPEDRCFLLQDSLFDAVFDLTKVEVQQLLLGLPTGALFAVARLAPAAGSPAEEPSKQNR